MRTLFHITTREEWNQSKNLGRYEVRSLASEGFIHLSRPHQVLEVAKRLFAGHSDLVLLQVSEELVSAPIKYEGKNGELFPHIYGPINLDAVIGVHEFSQTDHEFGLPTDFDLVSGTLIRKGSLGDESEIASCHTHAWQQSYRGIVPDSVLDSRPLSFRSRLKWWRSVVGESSNSKVFVAESAQHGIVAFCAIEAARDEVMQGYGEIGAIYALNEYKGKGIGAALFRRGLGELKYQGFKSAYLWVLKDNPTVDFYKRMGGKLISAEKTIDLGGPLVEIGFEWELK